MLTPPPPPPKKKGMGCLGCGCLILVILVLLFLGLVATGSYMIYREALSITSTTASTVQTFDGGDDMYNRAKQKLTDFDHDLHNNLAAKIELSADEINTLIARNPDFSKNNIHLFVTITNGKAEVQTSFPTGVFTRGLLKDRYLNGDTSFGLTFDPTAKTLDVDLQSLQINGEDLPKENLPLIQTKINPALNRILQGSPECKSVLDQAKSIEIKDNELVIETQ